MITGSTPILESLHIGIGIGLWQVGQGKNGFFRNQKQLHVFTCSLCHRSRRGSSSTGIATTRSWFETAEPSLFGSAHRRWSPQHKVKHTSNKQKSSGFWFQHVSTHLKTMPVNLDHPISMVKYVEHLLLVHLFIEQKTATNQVVELPGCILHITTAHGSEVARQELIRHKFTIRTSAMFKFQMQSQGLLVKLWINYVFIMGLSVYP